jgi:hypothetical protein
MMVKIVSDGTPGGTQVMTQDGKPLECVESAVIRLDHTCIKAELNLVFIPLETTAKATMLGPGGKEVRRIEYADGSSDEFSA